jgi:phosphocarrier protein HPr
MPERRVTVAAPEGLHARPAALFVKAAADAGTPVTIARPDGGEPADARSILAVLALDVRHGEQVLLRADGADAEAALDLLARLLASTPDAGEAGGGG